MPDQPTDGSGDALRRRIGEAVRHLRTRAGLSLSDLAERAGVGRSTIHAVESGQANPSIETLWALAGALGVPFGQLVEPSAPPVRVVRSGEGARVAAAGATFEARLLLSPPHPVTFEAYVLDVEPGQARAADAHIPGSEEHVLVLDGAMRVGPDDATVDLGVGDLASFPGDVGHRYEALEPGTRVLLLMTYR